MRILIMMQQVRLRFLFAGQVGGTTLNLSYSLRFIVGPLLHAQKLWGGGGGGGWVAYRILVSAQGPLVLGFWVWGLWVWGLGLTI